MKKFSFFCVLLVIGCSTTNLNNVSSVENDNTTTKKIILKNDIIKRNAEINRKIDILITNNDSRLKRDSSGKIIRPDDISPSGSPLYFETHQADNLFSSIKAESVKSGGSLNLNLYGSGVTVGVWDYGAIEKNHVEFLDSNSGTSNIEVDENENQEVQDDHPTAVTSCIYAKGNTNTSDYNFNGIAPEVDKLIYRDWDQRDMEILIALDANPNFILSNHSYGFPIKRQDGTFQYTADEIGLYGSRDKTLDQNANAYPFYLHVTSAGNEGDLGEYAEGTGLQYDGQAYFGYELLTQSTLAKNILTVGSISDETNLFGQPYPSDFSTSGPANDGRIKPEIVARGESVPVAVAFDNNGNGSANDRSLVSGTSFSSPIVTGGLTLLQELYKFYENNFMRSSTLKGLACHTADDVKSWNGFNDVIGPDPKTGYGVLNLEKAASLIMSNSSNQSLIQELEISNGQQINISFTVTDSNQELIATICWIDPEKTDLTAPKDLINDLDIRLEKDGTTYYPWKLNASDVSLSASKGDNMVDNLEKVEAGNEIGTYNITISHKGLLESPQKFSLIISGTGYVLSIDGNEKPIENTVLVYQDILKDLVFINNMNPENAINSYVIYNIKGEEIMSNQIRSTKHEIDSSALQRGIYLVRINTGKGSYTKKIQLR